MAVHRHTVLGIMSGSSLDGLDLACCAFTVDPAAPDPILEWSITEATTVDYPAEWRSRLRSATELNAAELCRLDADLGKWIGRQVAAFLSERNTVPPELIGCHGHTVYHEPAAGFTVQLGSGACIAVATGTPTVTDLRSADIAAGGQGAPLAPVADRHLFPGYAAYLNLGGIVNFSLRRPDGSLLAGDLTGCCQILDRLAAEAGLRYDAGGQLARGGQLLPALADRLRGLPFHHQPSPKSLSNQWVTDTLWPVVRDAPGSTADRLHTMVAFIAETVAQSLNGKLGAEGEVLVTGGGANNDYLRACIGDRLERPLVSPAGIADFKEAALVALCAILRNYALPNSLASATGAHRDTVNGALYVA